SPPASRQRADNKTPSPGLESQRRGLGGRDLPPSCSFPHTALRKGGAAWQGGCLRAPRPLAVPNGRRPWGWSPRLGGGRFSLPFRGRAFVCRVICGLLRLGRFLRQGRRLRGLWGGGDRRLRRLRRGRLFRRFLPVDRAAGGGSGLPRRGDEGSDGRGRPAGLGG